MGKEQEDEARVIPLFGRDEMNLIEFPFGPITPSTTKTLEVEHEAWDPQLKRKVARRMIVTGSDAFGLPKPIDDQVLVGMKSLTVETRFSSRKVEFSRYHLCRTIGWEPDGRAYARLEESFDRIAGTTLKFKDAWWDKGESEWKSKTFHLIEETDLCSRDRLDRARAATGRTAQQLCSFVWSEVVWKSFQDGFIKKLDMTLFRKIAQGRRREVPLRLFRVLDKRFWYRPVAEFKLKRLCIGTLGLCPHYSPSQMARVLDRAANWLSECGYLDRVWYRDEGGEPVVFFRRLDKRGQPRRGGRSQRELNRRAAERARAEGPPGDRLKMWLATQREAELMDREEEALRIGFGSELERKFVLDERAKGIRIHEAGRIRQEYVRRFIETRIAM